MHLPVQQPFPLEPVCASADARKISADTCHQLHFLAYHKLAHDKFYQMDMLYSQVFDQMDWEMTNQKLWDVPKMSQLWACKQVMGIEGTMEWDSTVIRKCPSCMQECNTCAHVLFCHHTGWVETLKHAIDVMEDWLEVVDTDPGLLDCIAEYSHGQDSRIMTDICQGLGMDFMQMAHDQDAIGWQRFMEGMTCTQMREIQQLYHIWEGMRVSPERWAQGLIIKLLGATHGQWIYRNIHIHDSVAGTQATLLKEVIQHEIEKQMELGAAGMLEEDHWMMEVNLGDIETTSGEQEEYWLVAIKATWVAAMLTRHRNQTLQGQSAGDGH